MQHQVSTVGRAYIERVVIVLEEFLGVGGVHCDILRRHTPNIQSRPSKFGLMHADRACYIVNQRGTDAIQVSMLQLALRHPKRWSAGAR